MAQTPVAPFVATSFPSPAESGRKTDFVLLTRILSYRNFAGEPFPISASPQACARFAEKASRFVVAQGLGNPVRLADCGHRVLRMLRERHLIAEPPVPLPGRKGVKYLALSPEERTSAWINEIEHLTWIQVEPGFLPVSGFAAAFHLPGEDAANPWARSGRFGFLASDPARAGAGTSFQILVHLPALALARKLGQVHSAMAALGVAFTPVTRMAMDGSATGAGPATGGKEAALFWLTFRGGMGGSPLEAYRRFVADVQPLFIWESEAQAGCLEKHRKRLEAQVHKSLQILTQARSLPFHEFQVLSSWVRLGGYVGILDARIQPILEDLRARSQTGHLEVSCGRDLSKEEADISRVNVVRLAMDRYRART